jgi:kumamolisin
MRTRSAVATAAAVLTMAGAAAGWSASAGGAAPATAAARPATWANLLAAASDLGPSRAAGLSLLTDLSPHGASKLRDWAASHDLRVDDVAHRSATLTGSAAALDAALGVSVDRFETPGGTTFTASTTDPEVPSALQSAVRGLGRISTYDPVRPAVAVAPDFVPAGGLTPAETLRAYNATPLTSSGIDGAGQTVVFFEVDAFDQASLDDYAAKFHLPAFRVAVDGGMSRSADEVESDMDIETVHGLAPQAKLVYVNLAAFAPSPNASFGATFVAAAQQVSRTYPGAVWSASLSACETQFTGADLEAFDATISAAESHGTTFYASSGDSGGLDCTPSADWGVWPGDAGRGVGIPAALPFVTGVGGTTLSVTATGDYVGETTWTQPSMSQGTGGGVSRFIPRPGYQSGPGVSASHREVPDVSADADNNASGTAIISVGASSNHNPDTATAGGGTSLATPIWAALTALMDGYLERHGGHAIGFINPVLYQFLTHSPQFPPFHDITRGSNDFYSSRPGYDAVTGVGSPNTANLTQDLLAAQKASRS